MLNAAVKPVLIAGVKPVPGKRLAFRQLADAAGCAVATMANAKGFSRVAPAYIGTYWDRSAVQAALKLSNRPMSICLPVHFSPITPRPDTRA